MCSPSVRVLEFYSGIGATHICLTAKTLIILGGLRLALSRSNIKSEVVQAFDWDQTACQVYNANHDDVVRKVDLHQVFQAYKLTKEANK